MKTKITQEHEEYYHLKYGFGLYTIHTIWNMSKDAVDLDKIWKQQRVYQQ